MDLNSWKETAIRHPNRERRCEALHQIVGDLGKHSQVIELLFQRAREDEYWRARTTAIQLLADIADHDKRTTSFFVACVVEDVDSRVRSTAVETLPRIWSQRESKLRQTLLNWGLSSKFPDVRQTAILAICEKFRDRSVLNLLLDRAEKDPDPIVRLAAIESLVRDWRDDSKVFSILCKRAERDDDPDVKRAASGVALRNVRIFLSYSHYDSRYAKLLVDYLSGELKRDGIELWWDERIVTGSVWDNEIRARIRESHIALVLVSQRFLSSDYCQKVEVRNFLRQRRSEGMVIFPIILSACAWQNYDWLGGTQALPSGDRNLKSHYRNTGKRAELFYRILLHLQQVAREIRRDGRV